MSRFSRVWVGAAGVLLAMTSTEARAQSQPASKPATQRLTMLERQIHLERDGWLSWRIDYRLRYDGSKKLLVPAQAIQAELTGNVSNSRIDGHARPQPSRLQASGATGLVAETDILPSDDESKRCRERLVVQVWPAEAGSEPPEPMARAGRQPLAMTEIPELELAPGQVLRARLRLEHRHPLYGPFEALLGARTLNLNLAGAELTDRLPLDRPRPVPLSTASWPPKPTPEFLDSEVYFSGPDSLHLEAHVPGKQSYRFPDFRGVPYGARMRLSFWYLVAPGTEGRCQVRISQYRDLPSSWKTLHDGELLEELTTAGRWVHIERVFRVQPEATSLTFDARILGSAVNVGELWIDDVKLEPADATALAGP